jgi:hypothetical protein
LELWNSQSGTNRLRILNWAVKAARPKLQNLAFLNDSDQSEQPELSVPPPIPLSDEERRILEQPIDPRVVRILNELQCYSESVEQFLANRHILPFPCDHEAKPKVVPGEAPKHDGAIV